MPQVLDPILDHPFTTDTEQYRIVVVDDEVSVIITGSSTGMVPTACREIIPAGYRLTDEVFDLGFNSEFGTWVLAWNDQIIPVLNLGCDSFYEAFVIEKIK